jgi:hypothetical protein
MHRDLIGGERVWRRRSRFGNDGEGVALFGLVWFSSSISPNILIVRASVFLSSRMILSILAFRLRASWFPASTLDGIQPIFAGPRLTLSRSRENLSSQDLLGHSWDYQSPRNDQSSLGLYRLSWSICLPPSLRSLQLRCN